MQPITFLVLAAAVLSVAFAAGQYYVPRAYYTIDAAGHESPPVPLRRLRRAIYDHPGADTESLSNHKSAPLSWSRVNSGSNGEGWYRPRGFAAK